MHKRVHGADISTCSKKYGIDEGSIIDFSSNVNIFLPTLDRQKIDWEGWQKVSRYPDIEYRNLRKGIGDYYGCAQDGVIPGNGASELIYLLTRWEVFRCIGIVQPTFSEYERGARIAGKRVRYFSFADIENILSGKPDVAEEVWEDLDCLILCNPNNPTGKILDLEKLPTFLEERKVHLMVDETFIDFMDNERYSLMKHLHRSSNLSILKAVTKYYALTGLRLGYLFVNDSELCEGLWSIKEPWTVNCMAESAASVLFALESRSELEIFDRESKAYYTEEVARLRTLYLKESFVRSVSDSATNFLLIGLTKGMTGTRLKEDLLRKNRFLIRTCTDFRGLDDTFIRIAVKEKEKNDLLIKAMRDLVAEG